MGSPALEPVMREVSIIRIVAFWQPPKNYFLSAGYWDWSKSVSGTFGNPQIYALTFICACSHLTFKKLKCVWIEGSSNFPKDI